MGADEIVFWDGDVGKVKMSVDWKLRESPDGVPRHM